MRTVFYTATTLDGFLADEDDSLEWLFRQPQDDPTGGPFGYDTFIKGVSAIAMGATTYLWVRDHLDSGGEAWPYTQPSWVFTHRDLEGIPGAEVRFTAGPVEQVHAEMAAVGDGDLWVVGGGGLAADFAAAGLLDELIVSIAPVTLGAGRPLFAGRFDLELLEYERNGALLNARYRVLGRLTEDLRAADA
ncbi:dihydrofolate reductase family protein [Micropruina sonneratiae]|uniref:dihydrofolate reductase family protein n=1 Tax=Micropruina sonneratiae TaxID=2986940 RepID=UPI00222719FB|nr:dihydrofolate reductase family protein [Micropruina sp. KQZ13P-5]MCW3159601.1 dihydrofolate reductase family protein [Micropruina sp. KQZ13P-5]